MHIGLVMGTRPEVIRLSEIIRRLDGLCRLSVVFTGQNFSDELSGVFFRELGVRAPDVELGIVEPDFGQQVGRILGDVDRWLGQAKPDRLLLLGDTNSALCSIVAARRGIPVYHLEAGNRCYDDRVPEEVNRRLIDHTSEVLLPYTWRSAKNLEREGIARNRIFVVGNPILEVIERHAAQIAASTILTTLGLTAGGYFLVTAHRAECVDDPVTLAGLMDGLGRIARTYQQPVVVSVHPRTRVRLEQAGIVVDPGVRLLAPFGFFDFISLEKQARAVLSDSGTVQEECAIFRVPNVTLRRTTERPETLEAGSNMIAGTDPDDIERATAAVLALPPVWTPPAEYLATDVSATVARIVLGLAPHRSRG